MQIKRTEHSFLSSVNDKVKKQSKNMWPMAKTNKEEPAATVAISSSGRERARRLKENSAKNEDYMKRAEERIDSILNTIRSGGTLSQDEEELVNRELKNMSGKKYKDYKELRLQPEDVMEDLKENYMRREKLFLDMQKQIEDDTKLQSDDLDSVWFMKNMQEQKQEEDMVEILEEYEIHEEDESDEVSSSSEMKEKQEEDPGEQKSLSVQTDDEATEAVENKEDILKKRALKLIENVEDQIKEAKQYSQKSAKKEREYARNLDEDYRRVQEVLNSEEVSIEDKVAAYDDYIKEAGQNARNREIERIKKEFDAETNMIAKIMFQGYNRADHVIKGNVDKTQLGVGFMKSFLK